MVLLPLVALGLERLVAEHKPAVSIVTLTITITANYYTGFMVCVASVLIYAALVFAHADGAAKVFVRGFGSDICCLGVCSRRWRSEGVQEDCRSLRRSQLAGGRIERMVPASHGAVFAR